MVAYRKTIYSNYHDNQVNKSAVDHRALLEQQSFYYSKELVPYLPKDKNAKIVDLGCGYGSFVHAAKQAGYTQLAGVDLSEGQVKVAHELGLAEVQLQSIEEYLATVTNLDCIIGVDIIEHFTKDELMVFLEQCMKALKPGGRVVFRTPNMDSSQASVYAFADISHETFLNKSSSLQVLKSAGYSNVRVHPSMIFNRNPVKELLRKALWSCQLIGKKIELFASGRTWHDVVFTPNLIIEAHKP